LLEPSNFYCPPAKPGVYLREIMGYPRLCLTHLDPPFFWHKTYGEFHRIALHYLAIEQEILRRIDCFAQVATVNSARLGRFAKGNVEQLLVEVSDWRFLVHTKNIKPY